jgi:DNA repair protein RadC
VKTIRTAQDVYEHAAHMKDLKQEEAMCLYLNSKYEVIHDQIISIGSENSITIHPRDVFKPAVLHTASAIILVHNHPSGQVIPSPSDIALTKRLVKIGKMIGIALLDHIIVAKFGFTSIPIDYS